MPEVGTRMSSYFETCWVALNRFWRRLYEMRSLRYYIFSSQQFSLVIKMISKENIILSFFVNQGVRYLKRVLLLSIILVMALWRWFVLGRDP